MREARIAEINRKLEAGERAALRWATIPHFILLFSFAGLYLHFRGKGGYKRVVLSRNGGNVKADS